MGLDGMGAGTRRRALVRAWACCVWTRQDVYRNTKSNVKSEKAARIESIN